MNELLAKRVRSAAVAGWWTILISWVFLGVCWGGTLVMLHVQPRWYLNCWGGGQITWDDVQRLCLLFFGVLKILLLVALFIIIWLTLWARGLRKTK